MQEVSRQDFLMLKIWTEEMLTQDELIPEVLMQLKR